MKKAFALILLLIFLLGCQSPINSNNKKTDTEYRKGTQGLVMSFVQGNPPSKLFSSSSFIVMAQIWNRGAFDVQNANIYLSGYDPRYLFGSPEQQSSVSIQGKSMYNPTGDLTDIVEFQSRIQNVPQDIDSFSQSIKMTACYYYETVANPEICINPRQYSIDASESVCQVKDVSLSGGQGAPVSITKVEEELIEDKILLKIYLQNSGSGTPFIAQKENCHKSLKINDVDIVDIKEVSFSNYQLTGNCKPTPVRLVNNNGFFICDAQLSNLGANAFVTPLKIRIGYNYRDTLTKTIEIVKI